MAASSSRWFLTCNVSHVAAELRSCPPARCCRRPPQGRGSVVRRWRLSLCESKKKKKTKAGRIRADDIFDVCYQLASTSPGQCRERPVIGDKPVYFLHLPIFDLQSGLSLPRYPNFRRARYSCTNGLLATR